MRPPQRKYPGIARHDVRTTGPTAPPRWRSRAVSGAFAAVFIALTVRAFWVQGINDAFYREQGDLRQVRDWPMHASRGRILDRNGRPLAVSLPTRTLFIDASSLDERVSQQQIDALARLIDADPGEIAKIYAAHRGFAYLKREVPVDVAERAMRLDLPGLFAQEDYRRYYPEGEIAAQITGFTGAEG